MMVGHHFAATLDSPKFVRNDEANLHGLERIELKIVCTFIRQLKKKSWFSFAQKLGIGSQMKLQLLFLALEWFLECVCAAHNRRK